MEPTFLETIWGTVYATAFATAKASAGYGGTRTDASIALSAAEQANAAVSNLPGANLAALKAAIAALKP